jgi:hypothetical protein
VVPLLSVVRVTVLSVIEPTDLLNQFTPSTENWYAVMSEPLGEDGENVTVRAWFAAPMDTIEGAVGAAAALAVIGLEAEPYPALFLARTLNVWSTPFTKPVIAHVVEVLLVGLVTQVPESFISYS